MKRWWHPSWWGGFIKKHSLLSVGIGVVLGITGVVLVVARPQPSMVSVAGLDHSISFWTSQKDLGAALREQGIEIGTKDLVTPALSTRLQSRGRLTVQIEKAIPITITVEGKQQAVASHAKTVGDLLQELSITPGEKDRLIPDQASPLLANMQIQVIRRTEKTKVTRIPLPFNTVRHEDETLVVGETREVQAGIDGVKEMTETIFVEDGKDIGSEITNEEIVEQPVNRIVAFGTAGVVSRGGREYRYTKVLDVTSTGYTAGKESNPNGNGYTYTGMKATRGVIAVDPRVIPLYTRLYVEGYGVAVAADIGGAIKGNKIDLCFDTLSEALQWGVRPVRAYILGD